ncbi:MAG: AAA family ATPase [Cellvibrionales bacterium]|nr:AAA family ATPase [Cellvibrionales bacterium]
MLISPRLIIFSGLPGAGKTTLAKALAKHLSAVYLRIDTIEQALKDQDIRVVAEGYYTAWRVAEDNLRLGLAVVGDSCNPLPISRQGWQAVAISSQAEYTNIEVICSDQAEHQKRVETRIADIPGLRLPTWEQVRNRDYEPWQGDRIVLDTAGQSSEESVQTLFERLSLSSK